MRFKKIWLVYLGGFFLALHYASVAYVNSSLLNEFVGENGLSVLYILGSLGSILMLVIAPFLLRKIGNIAVFIFFTVFEIFAIFGLGEVTIAYLVFAFFIMHQLAESVLYLNLDVLLEKEIVAEGTTGGKRGIFLTAQNIAWVIAPLLLALVSSGNSFKNIYLLSGFALLPLLAIAILGFKNSKNTEVEKTNIKDSLKELARGGDKSRIVMAEYILQFYFAWMVIYLPLLLIKEIGFSWENVGFLLTIMLLPYLFLELPAGILADKRLGEKEILASGFLVMFGSTMLLPFIKLPVFGLWAAALFITRIGTSMVEISSESYFFKHVKDSDTGLISLFRIARPASFVLASIISLPIIYLSSYGDSFIFLGAITLSGLFFIPKIDTK